MYVCLCNGHTSRQIEALARSGIGHVERAFELLGGPPVCGRCIEFAEAVMADARREAPERGRRGEHPQAPETAAAP